MTDEGWDVPGPGVTEPYDPRADGAPLKGPGVRKGPGRVQRSGSRRSVPLHYYWRDIMEDATFGRSIRYGVDVPRFKANVKQIRTQLTVEGHMTPKAVDELLIEAFKIFGAGVRSGAISAEGKHAWSLFYGRWARYVAEARKVASTSDSSGAWFV